MQARSAMRETGSRSDVIKAAGLVDATMHVADIAGKEWAGPRF
jgi:hypothetical protein